MKIAFLSRYQGQIHRGAENFVSEIILRLSKKYEVEILAGKEADALTKILAGHYDIVIPVNGRLQSLMASLGRLTGGYKLLITGHSGIGRDDIWNIAVAKPDVFVALTDYMANWAKKWAWGTKVVKIPNGIDINKFTPNGEKIIIDLPRPIILSVGALVWYKHHERVIRAIRDIGYGSVLIVGGGPEKENLEKLGRNLLGKRFKLASFKYEDMPKVYRSCNLFSLPSWDREAFGLVYLEALSSGLGIVALDDLSRREIIGEVGILTDVSDVKKYAQAIKAALAVNWESRAVEQAKKFSWDKVAKKYEEVIEEIL
ncbi:glycosyltransferase [Candidatus Daviesbacteria bacterium]|nr:glycosyltransferase [Candidatus Daviesbacteria bacterium]